MKTSVSQVRVFVFVSYRLFTYGSFLGTKANIFFSASLIFSAGFKFKIVNYFCYIVAGAPGDSLHTTDSPARRDTYKSTCWGRGLGWPVKPIRMVGWVFSDHLYLALESCMLTEPLALVPKVGQSFLWKMQLILTCLGLPNDGTPVPTLGQRCHLFSSIVCVPGGSAHLDRAWYM